MADQITSVGIVAIGRNEGDRLRPCLSAAIRDCASVVYVDSGSTDSSVELARSIGVHIVELDLSAPFTAARARNAGVAKLLQLSNNIDFIQFVDGDCEIAPGWIEKAKAALLSMPKAAIVAGRLRERFPRASIYNRLCDMEWDTPIGQIKASGGIAMIRIDAFKQVNGFNPAVIAGEEPEMCVRLRAKGWTIQRIDAEMGLHDAAMLHFSQWWKRMVRGGHAYAQGYAMHGQPPENLYRREIRSIRFWVLAPLLVSAAFVAIISLFQPRWALFGLAPFVLYFILVLKVTAYRRRLGKSMGDALIYAFAVVLGKFAEYQGLIKFGSAKRSGRQNAIIEYKLPLSPAGQPRN